MEKNDLTTYAALRMARKNMAAHLIFHKAEHDEIINHLVAHECGHILRMFGVPEEKRLIVVSNKETELQALTTIQDEIVRLSSILPIDKLSQIVNLWYHGIIRQVTNFPSDIMIEKWLYDDYPDLRKYQLQSIRKQLKDSLDGLKDQVRKITPPTIFYASNLMNYVFFRLLGIHFNTNFIKPYNNTRYIGEGKKLAELTEKGLNDSYEGDVSMVNEWVQFLDLSGWFKWGAFEDVPQDYIQQS
ncbi:MAG: hypothetical protein L7F78_09220 [Syntrophales bacterium LBB04]|nr:hypothetical protein [Syntrophales bacterium LBB04]